MKRIVVITGVSGGIGSATARLFHENNWCVLGVDLKKPENLTYIDLFIPGDLSDENDIIDIYKNISKRESYITALINNAAIQICKPLAETSLEEWDKLIRINLTAAYLMMRYAIDLMKDHGGAIVNIGSVHAIATSNNISAYAASKGALASLTRAAAIELSQENIRVNCILPGAIDTSMLHEGLNRDKNRRSDNSDRLRDLANKAVLRRIGRPDEVAQSVLFLADELRSSFITGQMLIVDGGALSRLSTE